MSDERYEQVGLAGFILAGVIFIAVGLRDGDLKYVRCMADPEQLFDLASDPHEMKNIGASESYATELKRLRAEADLLWDLGRFDSDVRQSQARRLVVYDALRNGAYYPWDFQPLQRASERYMRNHMDLNVLEESQRFQRGE